MLQVATFAGFVLCTALAEAAFTWPYQAFRTASFLPPVLNISGELDPAGGYLLFAPDGAPINNADVAPLIMDMNGELVWNGPSQHAFGFGVQKYQGEKVLVGWNGTVFREPLGRGNGVVYIWNKHYEIVATVSLPGNFAAQLPGVTYPSNIDVHEQHITPAGTMVVTANNVTQTDLTSVGGPRDGWVVEAQVYEIDIATNRVLFSWKSLDHLDKLPLNASVYPLGSDGGDGTSQSTPWGYFHHNSVEPFADGYIISSRYLSSAIAIDQKGNVLWRLSGINGADFKLGPGADFRYQHDIRVLSDQRGSYGGRSLLTLQLHDNHNAPQENGLVPTSGKVLDIDFATKEVRLRTRYLDSAKPVFATAQGSHRVMDNGNIFESNGWVPVLQEFSPNGTILNTIQFGTAPARPGGGTFSAAPANVTLSYRAFKQHWVGCPTTKPTVAADAVTQDTRVYVSWNGATEVVRWNIYAGAGTALKLVKSVKRTGFETTVLVDAVQAVQVEPVFRGGRSKSKCGRAVRSDVVSVSST